MLEEVAHTARADADEHFHKVRARNREERHVCLARDGLCKKRFARAGRANQKRTFRELRADGGVFLRVMKEVDDLDERFLRLVLTGHVCKGHTGLLFHVDLRLALTDAAEAAAHLLRHAAHEKREQRVHKHNRQHPRDEERHDRADLLGKVTVIFDVCRVELIGQRGCVLIGNEAGIIEPLLALGFFGLIFCEDDDAVVRLELYLADLPGGEELLEFRIGDLREIGVGDGGIQGVDQKRRNQRRDDQDNNPPCFPVFVVAAGLRLIRLAAVGVVAQNGTCFLWEIPKPRTKRGLF